MSKNLPKPQESEEVDLGQIFKLIGSAFDRFFRFIGSIFIGIYDLVIALLIHFYKRMIWYALGLVIGLISGFIIDVKLDHLYGANVFIETNFNSARQVYENIKQFQQLAAKDKDILQLAKILGINKEEASKLKGFYIEPDIDENYIVELYSEFYVSLDSTSRSTTNYENYKKSLTAYNFKVHQIGVASTDKYIFKKIQNKFIEQIMGNDYLKELADVSRQNLEKQDATLLLQIEKTDSLASEYLKIRINESTKQPISGSGTNLYLGNAETNKLLVDESAVIQQRLILEDERREVNSKLVKEKNIINIISGFPESGYDITKWYEKMKYLLPIVLFSITLIIFTIIGLGKYLDKKSKL